MTATDEPRTDHDLRCPEITSPGLYANPDRCTCRDEDGHTPRTPWFSGPMCALDFETTAANPLTARIVTATIIRIRPGQEPAATNWLSDVDGEEIPAGAAQIHGVTTERARAEGRPLAEVVDEVRTAIELEWRAGVPVVGWNIGGYDLTVLAAECDRLGQRRFAVTGPVLDGITLDRAVNRRYGKGAHTLSAACAEYGVQLSEADAHSSDADALAAARVTWKIARRYALVGDMSLSDLQQWQADQHRLFADDLGAYFRRVGKRDDVSREWPMRGSA